MGAGVDYACGPEKGNTPVKLAIRGYHRNEEQQRLAFLKVLLDHNPNLEFAGQYKFSDFLYLQKSWEIRMTSRTPLLVAVASGYPKIAIELLKRGARIDSTDEFGGTVIHVALISGKEELLTQDFLSILVAKGLDLNRGDDKYRTALHIVAGSGPPELVTTLLALGADPNLKDERGQSPLHVAAATRRNGMEISKLLIQAGADVNATDQDYRTPLYIAEQEKCLDTMVLLERNGGSVSFVRRVYEFLADVFGSPRLASA